MTDGAFEVLRFAGIPATAEAAVVELEGRFGAEVARRRTPRLRLEGGEEPLETPAAVEATLGDGTWRATYAVPLALLQTGDFALALDDLLLDLPRPTVEDPDGEQDRLVRLAREANDLRRRLDAARAGRAEAEARAERAEAELTVERDERASAERARDDEAATVASLREELAAVEAREREMEASLREELQIDRERTDAEAARLREELEGERAAAREREAAALAAREQMLDAERLERERAVEAERERAARELEEALSAEHARAAHASHELRAARAELEALHREGARGRFPPRPVPAPAPADEADEGDPPPPDTEAGAGGGENGEGEATTPIAARTLRAAPAEEPTTRFARRELLWATGDEPAAAPVEVAEPRTATAEGVRVLSGRTGRRRHTAEDENPEEPMPGAAAAGARQLAPADGSQELPLARILAVGALALVVLIVLGLVVSRL